MPPIGSGDRDPVEDNGPAFDKYFETTSIELGVWIEFDGFDVLSGQFVEEGGGCPYLKKTLNRCQPTMLQSPFF